MNMHINLNDPRLSPTQRLVLEQVRNTLHQAPHRPTDQIIIDAVDEALGCDDVSGKQ
jgi:hypothetical protein